MFIDFGPGNHTSDMYSIVDNRILLIDQFVSFMIGFLQMLSLLNGKENPF